MGNDSEAKEVDIAWLDNFIQSWENDSKIAPRGQYWARDDEAGVYVAVDNSTGDAWTEEFDTSEECVTWLVNPRSEAVRKDVAQPSFREKPSFTPAHKNRMSLKR